MKLAGMVRYILNRNGRLSKKLWRGVIPRLPAKPRPSEVVVQDSGKSSEQRCWRNRSNHSGATAGRLRSAAPPLLNNNELSRKCRRGFTLLEVLLVIGILSAIMYSIYLTFTSTLSSSAYVEQLADIKQQGRAFMRIFEREVSSAYIVTQSYVPKEGQRFLNPTFFIGINDSIEGKEMDKILFTTLAHKIIVISKEGTTEKLPIEQSEHAVISYFMDTLTPGVLFRFDAPRFITVESSELFGGSLPSDINSYRYPVLENVKEFSLQYYDWISRTWADEWDSTKTNRLPALVRLTLVLEDSSGNTEKFFNLVEIPRGMR